MNCRTTSSVPCISVGAAKTSNLRHYRALLQVLAYAGQRELTAEQVVRDAVTGGVAAPFTVSLDPPATDSTRGAADTSVTDRTLVLLLPSSKFIGTTAGLLADGFFCFAPFSSTVEGPPHASYQYCTECDVRDLFTMLVLLCPDVFAPSVPPRTVLSVREAEGSAARLQSSQRVDSELGASDSASLESPAMLLSATQRELYTPAGRRTPASASASPDVAGDPEKPGRSIQASSPPPIPTGSPEAAPLLLKSPTRVIDVDSVVTDNGLSVAVGGSAVTVIAGATPTMDAVPLSLPQLDTLLEGRRSLLVALLSQLNDALHAVQFCQLDRTSRTTVSGGSGDRTGSASESAKLQFSLEALLVAKVLLLSALAASVLWRRRVTLRGAEKATSVFAVMEELLGADAPLLLGAPVEKWSWGRNTEELGQWYDRLLDRLLVATDAYDMRLDEYVRSAKAAAVAVGRSVEALPTLLLHRPTDGQAAVELRLGRAAHLSGTVRLPSLPVQEGELQHLLWPRAAHTSSGALRPRGHEFLLDATASPTADFLQACASAPFREPQLRPVGDAVPLFFTRRLTDLSTTERRILTTALADRETLTSVVDRNAALLARLTLWCRGQWPPLPASQPDTTATTGLGTRCDDTAEAPSASTLGDKIADGVVQNLLFQQPFTAAVARYVRELVTLNGFDQSLLEAWVRHICSDTGAADTVDGTTAAPHRTMLAALIKFAVLRGRWTLSAEVELLQKRSFS